MGPLLWDLEHESFISPVRLLHNVNENDKKVHLILFSETVPDMHI